ncbi:MAG: T9SS type A sorting domain-containing protein [Bacteroidales bacterium]|nr:T9SS type A sorting domain-containing protein [Bacteroidales bacterium]
MKQIFTYFTIVFVWFVGTPSQVQGQSADTLWHVIGSAGGDTTISGITIEWTIGEIFVESMRGSRKRLTQGFHQGLMEILNNTLPFPIFEQERIRPQFAVFPNPFVDNLSVEWEVDEDLNLLFEVFSLDGRRVFYQRQAAEHSQLNLQLDHLNPQIYILRVSDPSRDFLEIHRIVKH